MIILLVEIKKIMIFKKDNYKILLEYDFYILLVDKTGFFL